MRPGTMFDSREIGKRIRRLVDGNYSYRKILIFIIICGGVLLYFGPPIAQWLFSSTGESIQAFEDYCMSERLAPFKSEADDYNVNILHKPPRENEHQYLPYIGNGIFGVPIVSEAWTYIKQGRALSLPIQWQPLISHPLPSDNLHTEATVTDFINGVVYHYQCLRDKYYIEFQYYAHRVFDTIMVQDVKIVNPFPLLQNVPLKPQASTHWSNSRIELTK